MAMEEELCLIDSCTIDTIFRDTRYFQTIRKNDENITTITGSDTHIVGVGRATIILPNGTELVVQEALLYPDQLERCFHLRIQVQIIFIQKQMMMMARNA